MCWVGSRGQVAALNRSDKKVTSEHGLQGGEVSASNSSIKAEAGAYLVSLRTEAQVGLELSRGAQCLGMTLAEAKESLGAVRLSLRGPWEPWQDLERSRAGSPLPRGLYGSREARAAEG